MKYCKKGSINSERFISIVECESYKYTDAKKVAQNTGPNGNLKEKRFWLKMISVIYEGLPESPWI